MNHKMNADDMNKKKTGVHYGIMANPGHNRVYFESSKMMALGELEIASRCFQAKCTDYLSIQVEGIFLHTFIAEAPLEDEDLRLLSRLSFVYAIFILMPLSEITKVSLQYKGKDTDFEQMKKYGFHSDIVMIPVQQIKSGVLGDDISTILKYSGKTNELFTRMMMNIGLMSGDFVHDKKLSVLDPLSGKGTTLFEAALSGWDASGVELVDKSVQEASAFFKKYLETGKYKHHSSKERLSGKNGVFKSEITRFEYSVSKEAQKAGEKQTLTLVEGDSRFANEYFKKEQFHMIVADLPYGVQHGSKVGAAVNDSRSSKKMKSGSNGNLLNVQNRAGSGFSSMTRNPKDLVKSCLPAWVEVLKPGGTIVLAWNRYVLKREELAEIFHIKGLAVLEESPYLGFEHQVDQSISRDMIVIKKVSSTPS